MPNGEGIIDPRYEEADLLRHYLMGLLAGAYDRAQTAIGGQIMETDFMNNEMIVRTNIGNYKVKIEVSF